MRIIYNHHMPIDPIYTKLDNFLKKFVSHISIIKATRPINLLEEKRKFFQSNFTYNPQFQYRPLKANLDQYRQDINNLLPKIPNTDIGKLYLNRLQECLLVLDLINQIGQEPSQFTNLSIKIYGHPEPQFIKDALYVLQLPKKPRTSNPNLTLDQIIQTTNQVLRKYNLTAPISVHKNTKNILSITRLGKIKIPHLIRRTQNKLNISLEHEIGTHLLRLSNGNKNPYQIFKYGTARYFQDEEGIAIITSRANNPQTHLRKTALSLITINFALEHSFSQTFKYLQTFTHNKNTLWNLTFRAKRGLSDTTQPGALTKDLYFQWTLSVIQQILNDPDLLNYAWNGKASLQELQRFTQPISPNNPSFLKNLKILYDLNTPPK